MFAVKHYPKYLSGKELDRYLAKGWYRMGQSIFTTHFLCFAGEFYSAIWIRLDLEDYSFRKSLRKIIRKNDEQFRWAFGPGKITPQRESLYQKYKQSFPGVIAPSILDSLQDGESSNIYNTMEFRAYDQRNLIALSYFDIGKDSAASILGIYHPDYAKHSLGFYTMLKEIAYCMDMGIRYYYPGYVVPGYNRFDYKARIGPVEYYNLAHEEWLPFEPQNKVEIPLKKIENKLVQMQGFLKKEGIFTELRYYPIFEANLFGFWELPYLDYPLFLLAEQQRQKGYYIIVIYDPRTNLFQILRCQLIEDFQFYFNEQFMQTFGSAQYVTDLLGVEYVYANSGQAEVIAYVIGQLLKRSMRE